MTFQTHPTIARWVDELNRIADFLALRNIDLPEPPSELAATMARQGADMFVLLGNSVLHTSECAFRAVNRNGGFQDPDGI